MKFIIFGLVAAIVYLSWRLLKAKQGKKPAASTVALAYKVLGLEDGASYAEVEEAHKKMISKLHPDKDGSDYLAKQINSARDILLEHLR